MVEPVNIFDHFTLNVHRSSMRKSGLFTNKSSYSVTAAVSVHCLDKGAVKTKELGDNRTR